MYKPILIICFLFFANMLFAQRGIVEGKMLDSNGEPIPGANVRVKNKPNVGTICDLDGNYSIECYVGDILVISFVGMRAQEQVVTAEMFEKITGMEEKRPKPIAKKPVATIKSKAYSDLISKKHADFGGYTDMYSAQYKWRYKNNYYSNQFYEQSIANILNKKTEFVFVKSPAPLLYQIEFNSYVIAKDILNLPKLQSNYAQGRPNLGVNTWFGAENNEVFAWGPKIKNLVYDGSNYPFDKNGRLIPKNGINTNPAKAYNSYNIFKTALVFKNNIKLSVKKDEKTFELSYTNRNDNGLLEGVNTTANSINFDFENRWNNNKIIANLNYFSSRNNFANANALLTNTLMSIMLTPPSFDNSQGYLLPDGTQRSSAPNSKNNPYFLLNANNNLLKNISYGAHTSYIRNIDKFDLGISLEYDKSIDNEQFYAQNNTVGFLETYNQNEEIDVTDFHLKLFAEYNSWNGFDIHTSAIFNREELNFLREIDEVENLNVRKNRSSLNWTQNIFYYAYNWADLNISLRNVVYITSEKQKWLQPFLLLSYNFADLINYGIFNYLNLSASYSSSVVETPLYLQNRSHNTLMFDLNEMNDFLENNELFYDENLDLETRQSFGVGIQTYILDSRILLETNYSQNISDNSIFPVQNTSVFELENIGSIKNESVELSLKIDILRYSAISWETKFIFSKSKSVVQELSNNRTQIPIAGFQSVSKNLIEGKEVGVIVGSAYKRNEQGQMIIGSDGYPLVSDNKQIIGDPNPDYYMAIENTLRISGRITLNILIDYQKGGDIWNGTKNTLNYYGLSENTATERNITNYIFEGVNEAGGVNTVAVDFANPTNGLDGNKWYKYGLGGVAEDAIEDGSWFRIKEISISYNPIRSSRKLIRELKVKLFVNNLWIKTNYSGSSPISYLNGYSNGQGLDYFNLPDNREIGIGLSIKF